VDVVHKRCARCQRLEVALDQLGAGGIGARVGRIPADRLQQAQRRLVDGVFPRREQPDMRPLADGVTDDRPGLQHHRFEPAFEEVGCRGKADGAGANDCD
jgi:hypothetical protein